MEPVPDQFRRVLSMPDLLRLDIGIMTLHMVLTAEFLVVPLALRDAAGLSGDSHWMVYLPVMLLSMVLMVPFVVSGLAIVLAFVGAVLMLAIGAVFYDLEIDDAPNYGNTGSTIGHELTHGFDDEGRQFDGDGNLRDWWTECLYAPCLACPLSQR